MNEMLRKNSAESHLQHEKLATAARFQPGVLLYTILGLSLNPGITKMKSMDKLWH